MSGQAGRCRKPVGVIGADDSAVEPHQARHVVFRDHALEIRLDLGAEREEVAPLRIRFERIRVAVRRHVAGQSRVAVLAPGAADARGLLEDRDVVEAGFAQLDAAQDAGHAGADHRDAEPFAGLAHGASSSMSLW
jgi:hypothetical protein